MDFKTFLENFDAIAQAPNGIPKLRSLILDLAARGKLVPQNPDDEPAIRSLERMRQEKDEVIHAEGFRAKNKKNDSKNNEYEINFSLPKKWTLAELDDLCIFIDYRGQTPPKVKSGIRLITAKNVRDGYIKAEPEEFVTTETYHAWMTRGFPKLGDVLFTTEAPLGKAAVVDITERFALAQRIINLRPLSGVYGHFLMWLILSPWFQNELQDRATGMTATGIKAAKLKLIRIPLPPLAEQKRIVEKVDELMVLCDRLQSSQQSQDNLRQKLRASAIASLMNAETDEELKQSWAIVRDNWQTLSQKPEDVGDLRRSVLQLALRGKLVAQIEEDEPAGKLLEKICEKRLQVEVKASNRSNILNETNVDGLYQTPENWVWCFASQLCYLITDGDHNPPPRVKSGIPHLTAKNVVRNSVDLQGCTFISKEDFERVKQRYFPKPGDLLLTCVGTLGRTAIVPKNLVFSADRNLAVLRLVLDYVMPQYVQLILNGPEMQDYIERANGKTAQPHIYLKQIRSLLCPLPPLAEQKRIVAKVDELMQLCDQLESSLRQSQQRAEALAASAISHLEI